MSDQQQPIKRGRDRPRKNPLPETAQAPTVVQAKPAKPAKTKPATEPAPKPKTETNRKLISLMQQETSKILKG